jgi:hypothetical protein
MKKSDTSNTDQQISVDPKFNVSNITSPVSCSRKCFKRLREDSHKTRLFNEDFSFLV